MKKFILILGIMPLFNLGIAQSKMAVPDFPKQEGKVVYRKTLLVSDSSYTSDRLFDVASQFIAHYPLKFKVYANDKYNFRMSGFFESGEYPIYNIKDAMSITGVFIISVTDNSIIFSVRNLKSLLSGKNTKTILQNTK